MAALSVFTLACAVAWALIGRRSVVPAGRRPSLPVADPFAWHLAGVFGLQAMPYFGLNAWLPIFLVEQAWTPGHGRERVGAEDLSWPGASLKVPAVMDRRGGRRTLRVTPASRS